MRRRSLDELMAEASRGVERVDPARVRAEVERGALIVDVRSPAARRRDGIVPGSLHLPLTVLPWRLEPGGRWRTPHVEEGARVLVMCDRGYSSLLAAALLAELGVDAANLEGGFAAWRDAGLPVRRCADSPLGADELQGLRPPEPG